jgi:hypothetical protein
MRLLRIANLKKIVTLQEKGEFAAVLEAISGGFELPQTTVATVYELTWFLASAAHIATVFETAVQTVALVMASVINCREVKNAKKLFRPFPAV